MLHKRNISASSFSLSAASPVGGVPLPGHAAPQTPDDEAQKKNAPAKAKKEKISEAFSFGRKGAASKKKHQRSLSSSSQQSDSEDAPRPVPVLRRHMSLKSGEKAPSTIQNERMSFPNMNTMWRAPNFVSAEEAQFGREDDKTQRPTTARNNSYKSSIQNSLVTELMATQKAGNKTAEADADSEA